MLTDIQISLLKGKDKIQNRNKLFLSLMPEIEKWVSKFSGKIFSMSLDEIRSTVYISCIEGIDEFNILPEKGNPITCFLPFLYKKSNFAVIHEFRLRLKSGENTRSEHNEIVSIDTIPSNTDDESDNIFLRNHRYDDPIEDMLCREFRKQTLQYIFKIIPIVLTPMEQSILLKSIYTQDIPKKGLFADTLLAKRLNVRASTVCGHRIKALDKLRYHMKIYGKLHRDTLPQKTTDRDNLARDKTIRKIIDGTDFTSMRCNVRFNLLKLREHYPHIIFEKYLELPIQRMYEVLRPKKRSPDAFKALTKNLKAFGITLNITGIRSRE